MDKLMLDEIIFRRKNSRNRGQNDGQIFRAENTSCGDVIDLYLKIENGEIVAANFDGELCSIANFGADLLCDTIVGRQIANATEIDSAKLLPRGAELLKNPVRLKCFELAQKALRDGANL
mgnify:CR=1 FL=1